MNVMKYAQVNIIVQWTAGEIGGVEPPQTEDGAFIWMSLTTTIMVNTYMVRATRERMEAMVPTRPLRSAATPAREAAPKEYSPEMSGVTRVKPAWARTQLEATIMEVWVNSDGRPKSLGCSDWKSAVPG